VTQAQVEQAAVAVKAVNQKWVAAEAAVSASTVLVQMVPVEQVNLKMVQQVLVVAEVPAETQVAQDKVLQEDKAEHMAEVTEVHKVVVLQTQQVLVQ
jgi:hypothetical protein